MKLIRSCAHALRGLSGAFREESNLRIHFLASTIVVLLGFYFSIEAWEWCILILVSTLVISLELINSGIENLVDLVTLEQNLMARKVKDIAAAAVLIAVTASLVIGSVIFGKYFL